MVSDTPKPVYYWSTWRVEPDKPKGLQWDDEPDERVNLSRLIQSPDELKSLSDDELHKLSAAHESEMVALRGRIDASERDNPWRYSARRALSHLSLHSVWIKREIGLREKQQAARRRAENRQATKEAKALAAQQREANRLAMLEAQRAKAERIRESNEQNERLLSFFKAAAKEMLPEDQYLNLWQRAQELMKSKRGDA